MIRRIITVIMICIIMMQCLICVGYAENNTGDNVLFQGVISQFDPASGKVKISGRIEIASKNQDIVVLALSGGTDIENYVDEDILYIRQIKLEDKSFSQEFEFFRKPADRVDIYVGGTNILTPAKTSVEPVFEYALVESLDVSVNDIKATAMMRNISEENKYAAMIIAQYDDNHRLLDMNVEEKEIPANSKTAIEYEVVLESLKNDTAYIKALVWDGMTTMFPLTLDVEKKISKELKVLAIGNSFSEDATAYLYQIAKDAGFEDVKIGNLYIGSCSLQTHWNNASNNNRSYTYYKNTEGSFTSSTSSIYDALKDEDWNIIVMQQVSGLSGQASSYEPYLTNLKEYVNEHKTNPDAVLAWHMTWAYQGNSTHPDFPKYNSNQMTMYNAITDTTKQNIVTDEDFAYIIPSGTAVQNMRTSYIGDNLTRDGFHLSIPVGRYTAGLTWFKTFTGYSIDEIDYAPSGLTKGEVKAIKEAVNNACKKPFDISNSSYSEYSVDLDNYKLLDYTPSLSSYWYSTNNLNIMTGLSQYASTKQFTKAEIPVGSIIVVENGWQYRPEGWISLDKLASSRPSNVSTQYVEVTEGWWGDYNYRAFNISKLSGETLKDVNAIKQNFKIYVPK